MNRESTPSTRTFVAVALVAAVLAGAVSPSPVAAAQELTAIDEDHPLATQQAIDEYRSTGAVSGSLPSPQLTLTIAEDSDDVGLDGVHLDSDTHYLRLQYEEDIERTIRIFIPAGYWHPYATEVTDENNGITGTFRPTPDGEYTAVEVTVDGPTDAVFAISKVGATVFQFRDYARDEAENKTGWSLPSLGASAHWEYVDTATLSNGSAVAFDESERPVTLQFDAGDNDSERWIAVPDCDSRRSDAAPYCQYTPPENESVTKLLAQNETASLPAVRYQYDTGVMATASSAIDDAMAAAESLLEQVSSITEGIEWL